MTEEMVAMLLKFCIDFLNLHVYLEIEKIPCMTTYSYSSVYIIMEIPTSTPAVSTLVTVPVTLKINK